MRIIANVTLILAACVLFSAAVFGEPPRRKTLPPKLVTPDGSIMVWIPGGTYEIGSDDGPEDSRPAHPVALPVMYVDQYEVTNEQYLRFCIETGHRWPKHLEKAKMSKGMEKLPVVNVTFADAEAYAQWARKKIPTEAQWEVAARGDEGFKFPWGNKYKPFAAIRLKKPLAVGSRPKDLSPRGVYDMAGNVMEWTRDIYEPYPGAPIRFEKRHDMRVVRGGDYKTRKPEDCALYVRTAFDKNTRSERIGFRCIKEIKYR